MNPTADRAELEEERDFLLGSLRDLDAERAAGDIDEADHARLRRDYTARAAAVLRALGQVEPAAPGEGTPGRPHEGPPGEGAGPARARVVARPRPEARPGRGRKAVAALAVVAVAAVAGTTVAATSGERLPGQEATGSLPDGSADRVARAQALVGEGRVLEAIKLYDEVIRDDPGNPVALSERGWLVTRAGLIDEGLASIDQAIAADPTYPQAHFFRGMVLWRDRQDPAGAAEEFRLVLEHRPPPDLVAYVRDARARALAEAEAKAATATAGTPAPPPAG